MSDEQGEHFHQDISSMEKISRDCGMLTDYCWTLARDAPTMEYKQQAKWGGGGLRYFVCLK
jgi:hypothetical protein